MKKLLLIPVFLFSFDFKQAFSEHRYKEICLYGNKHLYKIKNNEDTLSLVGLSCVKSDYLIYLPYIINYLKFSKKARENSIYFSLIFFDKKLLISYMVDNLDLSYYRLPLIDHPISIVLTNIINKNFTKEDDKIIIKNDNKVYKVYKTSDNKVFIDIYENDNLISSHWYR